MATIKIGVKKPGTNVVYIEVSPANTIKSVKEQLALPGGWQLWLGKKYLKAQATLEDSGVGEGASLNAIPSKVPSGYESSGQYQAAMRLQNATTETSAAHPELHAQLHEET